MPLYHQVYLALRNQILDGEITSGSILPGEHKLAEHFGVSRVTVRKTLQLLEGDKLVERRQGIATRVTSHPNKHESRFDLGKITGNIEIDGIRKFPTHAAELIAPPKTMEKIFAEYKEIVHLQRIRKRNGTPYSIANFYIPIPVMKSLDLIGADDKPMLMSITDAGFPLEKANQSINAISANDSQAKLLHIPLGDPLLFMTGTFIDPDDNVLMHTEGFFRPEYYEYKSTLYRTVTKDGARWNSKH